MVGFNTTIIPFWQSCIGFDAEHVFDVADEPDGVDDDVLEDDDIEAGDVEAGDVEAGVGVDDEEVPQLPP